VKYFLDSAKMDEIRYAYEYPGIDGVTTNPKHIMLSGKSFDYFIEAVFNWLNDSRLIGAEVFPVSVEIDPFLEKWDDMVAEGTRIGKICENFVIKLPCTEQGLIAARRLEKAGVRTNVTLVFSASQAIPAGKLGAKFVSPFAGWKENSGEDGFGFIADIAEIYASHGFETQIIAAALRNGSHLVQAALAGADAATCSLAVYKESMEHPFTAKGLDIFRDAWKHSAKA
jgi:transaldolase